MTTANIVSRASVGLAAPVDITNATIATSSPVIASVRSNVPAGSPNRVRQNIRVPHNRNGGRQDHTANDREQGDQHRRLVQRIGNPAFTEQCQRQGDDGERERPFTPPWFMILVFNRAHDKFLELIKPFPEFNPARVRL